MRTTERAVNGTTEYPRIRWAALGVGLLLAFLASLPAAAADCPDGDGDGYVNCSGGCDLPDGKACGDCNDGNAAIHPGASELCDAIDNDCDSSIDEGYFIGELCAVCDGPGCTSDACRVNVDCEALDGVADTCVSSQSNGVSVTSVFQCSPDQLSSFCPVAPGATTLWADEGGGATDEARRNDPTCFDASDNDCSGAFDHQDAACQTAEFCDGFDNDGDGLLDEDFNLGAACSAGIGVCATDGVNICSPGGNSSVCSAVAKPPKTEGPFGSSSCSDGKDNDCDGFTDFLGDADCQQAETCDGQDEDGDGVIDNGFPDLGDACSVGVGACSAAGFRTCNSNGSATTCSAVAGVPELEGPTNPGSCTDGIDNDCDGLVDDLDAGCGSADFRATCSLHFHTPTGKGRGKPGGDCNSWREIDFGLEGGAGTVSAELLGIDPAGNVLVATPVQDGEVVHLKSRTSLAQTKLDITTTGKDDVVTYELDAPIPLLKVTATDGVNTSVAYCSSVPYLEVVQPSGGVVTETQGNLTDVVVALPLVDVTQLFVKVDGVDILSALGIDPAFDFPGGPFGGTVNIHGTPVEVVDLVVDADNMYEAHLDLASSNTLTMQLSGLPCGGHVIVVDAEMLPGALRFPITAECHQDDVLDKGFSSVFAIDITTPTPGVAGFPVPTPVEGEVCHGLEIAGLQVNGKKISTDVQDFYMGDGEDSADTYILPFATELGRTDIVGDLASPTLFQATFDAGSNQLVADATDVRGNRTFKNFYFATGQVASPGLTAALSGIQDEFQRELQDLAIKHVTAAASHEVVVENAFVAALTPDGINTLFQEKCKDAVLEFKAGVGSKISIGQVIDERKVSGGCSCDPTVRTRITAWSIDENDISCPVTFLDGTMHVLIDLPDVSISLRSYGHCKTTFLGACVAETIVEANGAITLSEIKVEFDITEEQLEGTAGPGDVIRGECGLVQNPPIAPVGPACGDDSDCTAPLRCVVANINTVISNAGTEVNCLASACNWVANAFIFLANVITFGAFDDVLTPVLVDFSVDDIEFNSSIGADEADPIELGEIKLDEEQIEGLATNIEGSGNFPQNVEIDSSGLVASLEGKFSTLYIDPSIPETPGAALLMPTMPTMAQILSAGGGDASVLLNSDSVNLMFASTTQAGLLKTTCTDIDKTVGDLLPPSCGDILVDSLDTAAANIAATDAAQALCQGVRVGDCETLASENFLLTPLKQGICHGYGGATCSLVAAGIDGVVYPTDCETIVVELPDNPTIADLATAAAQGICHGRAGNDCETLVGATDNLTSWKQGACHGTQGADCQTLLVGALPNVERGVCEGIKGVNACGGLSIGQPINCNLAVTAKSAIDSVLRVAEQEACESTPALNITAGMPLLFCTQQNVPPTFLVTDNSATTPVETALRLNDLAMSILVDRDADGADDELPAIPQCFSTGAPTVGDCNLAGVCLDINFLTSTGFELCSDGKPGLVTTVDEIQILDRQPGVVCSARSAGDDGTLLDESATDNATIVTISENVDTYTPPVCSEGLTLGGFVQFVAPKVIAVETGDAEAGRQEYIGLSGDIEP